MEGADVIGHPYTKEALEALSGFADLDPSVLKGLDPEQTVVCPPQYRMLLHGRAVPALERSYPKSWAYPCLYCHTKFDGIPVPLVMGTSHIRDCYILKFAFCTAQCALGYNMERYGYEQHVRSMLTRIFACTYLGYDPEKPIHVAPPYEYVHENNGGPLTAEAFRAVSKEVHSTTMPPQFTQWHEVLASIVTATSEERIRAAALPNPRDDASLCNYMENIPNLDNSAAAMDMRGLEMPTNVQETISEAVKRARDSLVSAPTPKVPPFDEFIRHMDRVPKPLFQALETYVQSIQAAKSKRSKHGIPSLHQTVAASIPSGFFANTSGHDDDDAEGSFFEEDEFGDDFEDDDGDDADGGRRAQNGKKKSKSAKAQPKKSEKKSKASNKSATNTLVSDTSTSPAGDVATNAVTSATASILSVAAEYATNVSQNANVTSGDKPNPSECEDGVAAASPSNDVTPLSGGEWLDPDNDVAAVQVGKKRAGDDDGQGPPTKRRKRSQKGDVANAENETEQDVVQTKSSTQKTAQPKPSASTKSSKSNTMMSKWLT